MRQINHLTYVFKHTCSFNEPLAVHRKYRGREQGVKSSAYFSNSLHIITCNRISSGAQGLPLGPKYLCQKPQLAYPIIWTRYCKVPTSSKSMPCLHPFLHPLIHPSAHAHLQHRLHTVSTCVYQCLISVQ